MLNYLQSQVLPYLVLALTLTLKQLVFVFGIGMLLAMLMQFLNLRLLNLTVRLLGEKAYIYLFAWIGVPVHEMGHVIFCVLFRHRIADVVFFDREARSGTYGYVNHSYNSASLYQRIGNFFIGIGPIFLGSLAIWLLHNLLLNKGLRPVELNTDFSGIWGVPIRPFLDQVWQIGWQNLLAMGKMLLAWNWKAYLFIYLAFAIGTNINLSPADLKHLLPGFFSFLLLLVAFNIATVWIGDFSLVWLQSSQVFFGFFYAMLVLVLFLCFTFLIILYIFAKLFGS